MAQNWTDPEETRKERMRRKIIGQPGCKHCDDGLADGGMGQDSFYEDCTHCDGTGYEPHTCSPEGVCVCIVLQANSI